MRTLYVLFCLRNTLALDFCSFYWHVHLSLPLHQWYALLDSLIVHIPYEPSIVGLVGIPFFIIPNYSTEIVSLIAWNYVLQYYYNTFYSCYIHDNNPTSLCFLFFLICPPVRFARKLFCNFCVFVSFGKIQLF